MSLSELIRNMAAAGAPPEAIALAVEAIEARDATIEARRVAERERKRRQRAGQSRDSHGTVTGQSRDNSPLKERSPPIPPSKENNPPSSLSSLRSESEPRAEPTEREIEARQASKQFLEFWEAYPHKVGKPKARTAFKAVSKEFEAIMEGLKRYKRDKPIDRSWLNPSTFLNQRRWEDDPAPVANARGSPAREETSGVAKLLAEAYGFDRRNGNETAGNPSDFLALSVTHERVGTADYGDDGGVFRGLRRPDG